MHFCPFPFHFQSIFILVYLVHFLSISFIFFILLFSVNLSFQVPKKRADLVLKKRCIYTLYFQHDLWWGFLEQSSPNIWIRVTQNGDCSAVSDYFLNTCYPVEKYLILASLWDPLLPDPAFDRHFPSYWMDRVQTSLIASKNGKFDDQK